MRVGFAAAVASAGHAHQAGIELVLHVALENAVLDQRGALGRRTFVIDAQRTTAAFQGTVIDNGAQARGDLFAHVAAVGRAALAVEVAFQAMAHRLVQQHPGPARTEHHRQGTGRRRNGFEVDQCLTQGLTGKAHDPFVGEIAVIGAPATTMTATFAATVLLNDDTDVEAHQRANVGRQAAIGGGDQNALPDPGHAHGDLLDTWIELARGGVDALEQLDLFGAADHLKRVVGAIQLGNVLAVERLHAAVLPGTGNRTGRAGRRGQGFKVDGVTVGKAGLLAGLGTHAHALVKIEAAFFDDAVFQRPGFGNLPLEVQVGGIDAWPGQLAQHRLQAVEGQAARRQQVFADSG
ncbi:hypothetical protein D3C78_400680 [compost metagenome]